MEITTARANLGLFATAQPTSTETAGQITIGSSTTQISLTDCNVAYAVKAQIVSGDVFAIDIVDNDTSASDAWSAGTAQVETATAAGTVTASGNASVTVTAAGMTGSPKTINVAVLNGDTAATWAGKVRTALAADTAVDALFTVGGTSTAISLTRKASAVGILPANDGTLNIALANGTSTGITTTATSANTTAGVASAGANVLDGDGKDFEGITIPTIATLKGIRIKCNAGEVDLTSTNESATIASGEDRVFASDTGIPSLLGVLTFTATADSEIVLTVIGKTA